MGEVYLGMPGAWADDYSEPSDHYTTKIGGLPDWPTNNIFIAPDLRKCSGCGVNLCLVAQIYAPLSIKTITIEERVIYIFGCPTPKCGSSTWRALRVQKATGSKQLNNVESEVVSLPHPSIPALKTDWRENLWSFDSVEKDNENDDKLDLDMFTRAFSEAASMSSDTKKKDSKHRSKVTENSSSVSQTAVSVVDKTPVLPCFYIYSQDERVKKEVTSVCSSYSSLSIKEKQSEDEDQGPEEAWEGETYEYDHALSADRTYLKFKKRVDTYPEQCFRYSYGGKPLLANGKIGEPGKCDHCGEPRHYELQLMSPLLYFLQKAADKYSLENWDWITLIVYTCSKACSRSSSQEKTNDGWFIVEEAVVAQHE